MEKSMRKGSHTVSRLICHIVWATEYRYHVLKGDVQKRCRALIIQICDVEDVKILKGVVSKDHVHIHIEYPPRLAISQLMKRMKGRSSRLLQKEFPQLRKRYWGRHFWATGYGAWSSGNITDEMVQQYLEHHRREDDNDGSDFILEWDFQSILQTPALSVQGIIQCSSHYKTKYNSSDYQIGPSCIQ